MIRPKGGQQVIAGRTGPVLGRVQSLCHVQQLPEEPQVVLVMHPLVALLPAHCRSADGASTRVVRMAVVTGAWVSRQATDASVYTVLKTSPSRLLATLLPLPRPPLQLAARIQ